jgi:hypothetical protein
MYSRANHLTGMPLQGRHGWWHITGSVAIIAALGLALPSPPTVQAKTFQCRAGDVRCLIAAINEANANRDKKNAIRLEAGTYTLVDIDNTTDGPNGLPSITSALTITGAEADLTVLELNVNAPSFRLVHVAATGILTLDGLTIQGFSESPFDGSYPGGGLYNRGTLTLSNVAVLHNFAWGGVVEGLYAGGGLYNRGTLTLSNTTVADNGGHYYGGGLANVGGTVRISQSTIARNGSGVGGGGGIINTNGGTLILTNTAVIDNRAFGIGGLYNVDGRVTITNSTFAGNADLAGVGALTNGGTLTLVNTTVADNEGGGLSSSGTTVLVNTILARNTNFGGSDCDGAITSHGNNLIGDLTGCTVTLQGTDRIGESGLGPFSNDETPGNGHFPLLSTSQAINAGNPAVCPKTDQLGEKRVGPCDIGAIEFQGTAVSSR